MVLLLYGRMVEKIDQPINRCQRGFGRAHYLAGNIKQCVCEFLIAVVKTLAHEDQNTDNQARQTRSTNSLIKGMARLIVLPIILLLCQSTTQRAVSRSDC